MKTSENMIKGILFDMDGLMFDTETASIRIAHEVAHEGGYSIPDKLLREVTGGSHEKYFRLMRKHLGSDINLEDHLAEVRRRQDDELARLGIPKMKGLDALLAYLQKGGYLMAVASSTGISRVLHHVESAGISSYFTAIIGGDMVANYKPHPEIFETAARAIGLSPQNCLALEDSRNGIKSAAAAGCISVMVPDVTPADDELRALAAAILPSLEHVPAFIERYNDV